MKKTVEKKSGFGVYTGYSEARYDGYQRHSDYLPLSDGNRLAYDLLLPTRKGVPASERLPVLFTYTTYLRAMKVVEGGKVIVADLFKLSRVAKTFLRLRARFTRDGHLFDQVFRSPWLKGLTEHGYAVVAVERPGTGASSGIMRASFECAADEADEILNWIAAQPWCDGNIGMFGASMVAMAQYAAASAGNPHLKAIFPCSSGFDLYDAVVYPGGVLCTGFGRMFSGSTGVLERMIVPVDSDEDGTILAEILRQRAELTLSGMSQGGFRLTPFRDSDNPHPKGNKMWEDGGLYPLLDRVNRSGVAIYNSSGWGDLFARDVLLWHANLTTPRRIHMRPWFHVDLNKDGPDLDFGAEVHRWFDYWLKGVDNGIMDEPPFRYRVVGAPEESAWRVADRWPLPDQRMTPFYLAAGRTGTVGSVNDGFLVPAIPSEDGTADSYVVDYSTSSGVQSRWCAVVGPANYADRRLNGEKALTYTTSPLEADVEVTGHPVVHLWIATDAPDLDVFVHLEEVDPRGRSTYVTEGNLRASHRSLGEAPYDKIGLPYHRSFERDLAALPPGEPVELVFDLLPISRLFRRANRIRVVVTCADADNFETPVLDPAPELRLLREEAHASRIELPIIPS